VEVISRLAGGLVDLEENEDINQLKTRLLSSEEGRKRVIRIDNLKRMGLSWSALEKFITSSLISGKALYEGEGQRPNTLTVFITMNCGTFGKDMALRVIPIRLARPQYSAGWLGDVSSFIETHRWPLIAEILGVLSAPGAMINATSRWGPWEKEVLAQCSDFEACQREIASRIQIMDDDDNDAFEIEALFAAKLTDRLHDPENDKNIKIPTSIAAEWFSFYSKKAVSANRATNLLNSKPLVHLTYKRTKFDRFWVWKFDGGETIDLNPLPWDKSST
jgi:hypothetical protein